MKSYPRSRVLTVLVCVFILIGLFACEESKTDITDKERSDLVPLSETMLDINDIQIRLDSLGRLMYGQLADDTTISGSSYSPNLNCLSGFWVGQETASEYHANLIWNWEPFSNFTSMISDSSGGIYRIEPTYIDPDTINWPFDLDFPSNGNDEPKLLGDLMLWMPLVSAQVESPGFYASPIPNVSYSYTVWAYDEPDLSKTMFLRLTIRNNSTSTLEDLRIGFFSDTDLDWSQNATGYDSLRALTYTYTPSDQGHTYVGGYTFLDVDGSREPALIVSSHRIMRKNNYLDPDFGEIDVTTPEQIIWAMKGLSNSGQPMINPVTGASTLYAFTGDPVAGTGWIDTQIDVRSLLNSGLVSIAAGEQISATVVFSVVIGDSLQEGINGLRETINEIRSKTELWVF